MLSIADWLWSHETFGLDPLNPPVVSNEGCSNVFSVKRVITGAFELDPSNSLVVSKEG